MKEIKMTARPWQPQDLLDDLQLMIDEQPDNYLNTDRETLCTAKAYLEEYFSKPKWIPVTERLPDKPGRYIICEELGRVMIAGWDTSCWFGGHSYSEFTVYKATHWMPLPSAEGLV